MLLSAQPTIDVGTPGCARCLIHILKSPGFEPEIVDIGHVVSIGSGNYNTNYQELLAAFSSDMALLLRGEVMGMKQGFLPLVMGVQRIVEENPVPGISPHAHICVVRRGEIAVLLNDENRYP